MLKFNLLMFLYKYFKMIWKKLKAFYNYQKLELICRIISIPGFDWVLYVWNNSSKTTKYIICGSLTVASLFTIYYFFPKSNLGGDGGSNQNNFTEITENNVLWNQNLDWLETARQERLLAVMNKLGHEKGMFDVSLDVAPDIITLPFFFNLPVI